MTDDDDEASGPEYWTPERVAALTARVESAKRRLEATRCQLPAECRSRAVPAPPVGAKPPAVPAPRRAAGRAGARGARN